ncbi:MAG: hypothetical protein JW703_03685 [Candidatus Diapherotrites archaeon]|nr:hypothetical protein [Candidatus Diapherotrites archaeon]
MNADKYAKWNPPKTKTYKCMNCGKEIASTEQGNPLSKRFCSEKCRQEYLTE